MAGEDHSEARVTVWLSEEMKNEVDDNHVDWQYESRSQWLREAAASRMVLEDALDAAGRELPDDADEREALIEEIVTRGVAALDDDA